MKKVLLLTAAIALLAVPAMAGIKTSRHNLSSSGIYTYRTNNISQICVFCHTPHNPVRNVPLWNRNDPSGAGNFKLYTGSATIKSSGNKIASINGNAISLFCLSCHDGANGLWALVKNQGTNDTGKTATGTNRVGATRTNIGADQNLTNDHPVNVRIGLAATDPNDVSTNWNAASDIATNGLRLFSIGTDSDYVECASCHDPHKTENKKFLRKANTSSNLCLTCHNK